MNWKVGQAKQRFSEVVRRAQRSPQLIENRDELVAAVVGRADFEALVAWKKRTSMATALDELETIAREEDYALETPARKDRDTGFGARPSTTRRR